MPPQGLALTDAAAYLENLLDILAPLTADTRYGPILTAVRVLLNDLAPFLVNPKPSLVSNQRVARNAAAARGMTKTEALRMLRR